MISIRPERRHSCRPQNSDRRQECRRSCGGFTLIELLVVMTIIVILAGLVIGVSGFAQKKGARSRAEAEILALSAALEGYKADNGIYPRDAKSDALDAKNSPNPSAYSDASLLLYNELAGCTGGSRTPTTGKKSYFAFKPNMLSPSDQTTAVTAVRDPFGNSYGYSTANQLDTAKGYNPTFDLWSTSNGAAATDVPQWVKNW